MSIAGWSSSILSSWCCTCETAGADSLMPLELALKISTEIRAGERFAVYIKERRE
uniref:Uncharacterized protein n=1 Tax=Aegilops tauschii subsp. strangulata TaxID=200361 RepID=A0A453E0X3_AEGTS